MTHRRSVVKRLLPLLAVPVVLAVLPGAHAATPSQGTVSPTAPKAQWEGEHYVAGATIARSACSLPTNTVCDHFDLTVDVDASHWERYRGGVVITITWASAEDDFDLHVYDSAGTNVGSSTNVDTTSERVFVENASGTYSVRVNPWSVTDSGYKGEAVLESRRRTDRDAGGVPTEPVSGLSCSGGMAGPFPCRAVDLESFLPFSAIGGGQGNDIWGWTDRQTGREYALMGKTNGTAFVDITVPDQPVYLGDLPSHQPVETFFSTWRDIKVFENHAYVVSEEPLHGMQVFDLTRLRGATEPRTWTEDAHYALFGNAHNIAINEDSGFAYAIGTSTCAGGPHMIDIREPRSPAFAGCAADDGYTHDTQCVDYEGPDIRYSGHEICFSSNEDTLTIVDVTNKLAPVTLSRTPYEGAAYTHQGWLTEDQRHFLLGDELDEIESGVNTTTYIFDVASLTDPVNSGVYRGPTEAIDHNLYTKGNRVFEANYRAGLRVLDSRRVGAAQLREIGSFDIYPADDQAEFNGAWSNYPYFSSGVVIVSGIEQGLFVLRPR